MTVGTFDAPHRPPAGAGAREDDPEFRALTRRGRSGLTDAQVDALLPDVVRLRSLVERRIDELADALDELCLRSAATADRGEREADLTALLPRIAAVGPPPPGGELLEQVLARLEPEGET